MGVRFEVAAVRECLKSFDLTTLKIPGVLQRIALCYLAAGTLFLLTSWRTQALVTAGLLLGYWAVMTLVPADRTEEEPAIFRQVSSGLKVEPYETKRQRKDGSFLNEKDKQFGEFDPNLATAFALLSLSYTKAKK